MQCYLISGTPTNQEIVLAQLLTLTSIVLFNLGALFCYKSNKKEKNDEKAQDERNIIYKISKLMAIMVIPVTFFQMFYNLFIRIQYGYVSLYYGEHMNSSLIQELFSRLFYVCLFGLLIGSGFKQKTRRFTYCVFLLYIVISIICGDRGGWVYALCFFVFLHFNYVKKMKIKNILIFSVIGIISLNIISALVSVRNTDLNMDTIKENLEVQKSPIVSLIAEMGGSMNIQTVLLIDENAQYPYGNTYINSLLGMITDKVVRLFNPNYIDLSTWFSKEYLGLKNWGAGFSIVGEAYINFGPYIAPLAMMIIGWIVCSLVYLSCENLKYNPKKVMYALIAALSLIPTFRGVTSYNLKIYVYRLLIFFILYMLFYTFNNAKKRKEKDK